MQCDIDILGDASINAEIELIYATSLFLLKAGIGGRTVLINDRRVLRALIDACGFEEPAFADVLISLDKYDKIGMDGVCAELKSAGYAADAIDKYKDLFGGFVEADDKIAYCEGALGDYLDTSILADIRCVIDSIRELSYGENTPRFDISLVRGMGYYTGMVFEVVSTDFGGSSIAGGGRYDAMVGNFTGNGTPACGFSIGFERIVDALLEKLENESSADQGIDEAIAATGVAVLYDKSFSAEDVTQVQKICMIARKGGENIAVMKAAKNAGHQKAQLEADGFGLFLQLKSTDDILGLADRLVSQ
jgi:histidyl-tRNA synthetase